MAPTISESPPTTSAPRSGHATRTLVLLGAAVVFVGLASPGRLWRPYVVSLIRETGKLSDASWLSLSELLAIPVGLLAAHLSDVRAMAGWRREPYIVVGALMSVAGWILALFVDPALASWSIVSIVLGVGSTTSRVVLRGAWADLARLRHPGVLAAGFLGLGGAVDLLDFLLGSALGDPGVTATATLGLALSVLLAAVTLILARQSLRPTAPPVLPLVRLRSYLSSRLLWVPVLVGLLAGVSGALGTFRSARMAAARIEPSQPRFGLLVIGGLLLASVLYALSAVRMAPRRVMTFGLAANGLAAVAALALVRDPGPLAFELVGLTQSLGWALSAIALLDLTLRAAPPGHEALGCVLVSGLSLVGRVLGVPLVLSIMVEVPRIAILTTAALSLLSLAALVLLPRDLVRARS